MGNIHVRDVDEQILFKLKEIAKDQQTSLSQLVREILDQYVEDGMLSSSVNKFQHAMKEAQISLDNNTDSYNEFIKFNQSFQEFLINLMTNEALFIDEDDNNID